jgi:hypothetical protein
MAKTMQVQSNLDMKSSLDGISNAFNLSEKEMNDYLLLTQAGVEADKAAILVKNEKAMAILRE